MKRADRLIETGGWEAFDKDSESWLAIVTDEQNPLWLKDSEDGVPYYGYYDGSQPSQGWVSLTNNKSTNPKFYLREKTLKFIERHIKWQSDFIAAQGAILAHFRERVLWLADAANKDLPERCREEIGELLDTLNQMENSRR